jgi:serine/threonine protein kinase
MIILLLQVKCYMQQLLCGLEHCHSRHILHRDIKGSNLLIDNRGILKIADFGLASFFDPEQRHPLTSRVVTLWYRPPELLLGATNYGVAVDLWSSGCILAELYAGKPIMPGRTEVEQLHKIFKLCGSPSEDYWRKSKLPHATIFKPQHPYARRVSETFKDFPPPAVALVDVLLSVDPADRGTASSALQSEVFKFLGLFSSCWRHSCLFPYRDSFLFRERIHIEILFDYTLLHFNSQLSPLFTNVCQHGMCAVNSQTINANPHNTIKINQMKALPLHLL